MHASPAVWTACLPDLEKAPSAWLLLRVSCSSCRPQNHDMSQPNGAKNVCGETRMHQKKLMTSVASVTSPRMAGALSIVGEGKPSSERNCRVGTRLEKIEGKALRQPRIWRGCHQSSQGLQRRRQHSSAGLLPDSLEQAFVGSHGHVPQQCRQRRETPAAR